MTRLPLFDAVFSRIEDFTRIQWNPEPQRNAVWNMQRITIIHSGPLVAMLTHG